MSHVKIDKVANAAEKIEAVGQLAERVADELAQALDSTAETLEMARGTARQFRDADAKLRATLGIGTNFPPAGE